jgi:hypothetical protein
MALQVDKKSFGRLAKGDRLVPHLEKVIGQGDFEWSFDYTPKRSDDAFHPSTDCTPSTRELYLKATDRREDDDIRAGLRKTFLVGHFWHQYIQHLLVRELGYAETSHIERTGTRRWGDGPYRWVTGSADVAPLVLPGGEEYLLDIKTMNAHSFRALDAPAWAVDKWECQLNIYMDFFDLEKALILGVEKDSPHDFREFEFTRNDKLIEALYAKWKLVGKCIDADLEPPDIDEDLPLQGPRR